MTGLAAVCTAVAVLVVGLGASLAFFPANSVSLPTRIASIFGLGYAVIAFAGTALVIFGLFSLWSLLAVVTAGTVASYAVGARRSHPRDHWRSTRREFAAGGSLLWLGLAAVLFVAISWIAIPILPMAGGWRYWADALELADRGAVPGFTAQWGAAREPAISKLGGSGFLGALSFGFRAHPFAGMAVALWVAATGYAAGLFALGRELGLRWSAPFLALLGVGALALPGGIVLNGEIAEKLAFYQHEDMGRMLAAVGAAIVLARSESRSWLARPLAGGIVLAAGGLTHLIPLVVFGAFVLGAFAVRMLLEPRWRQTLREASAVVVVAVALIVVPLALAGGEVGFSGATAPGRYVLLDGKYDPTARVKGLTRAPRPKSVDRWYESPASTLRRAVEATIGRTIDPLGIGFLLVCAGLGAAVVMAFGSLDLRSLLGGAVSMALAIGAIALLFSYRYSLYAQATFGERRLFEYGSLSLLLLVLAVAEVAAAALSAKRAWIAGPLAAAGLAALAISLQGDLGPSRERGSLRYVAAAASTPCDARLLVDRTTRGSFQALTGRISVTEGLVPFLRPTIVNSVLAVETRKHQFFRNPDRFARLLADEQVDFVLTRPRPALRLARSIRFVREVDGIAVYEVAEQRIAGTLPRPTQSPGYHCFSHVVS